MMQSESEFRKGYNKLTDKQRAELRFWAEELSHYVLKFPTPKKWGGNGNKSRKICNLASANKLSIKQIQTYCYGSKIR